MSTSSMSEQCDQQHEHEHEHESEQCYQQHDR